MNIGVVGSRSFPQLELVAWLIRELPEGLTIVSGGADGVDQQAAKTARARGLAVVEYLPQVDGLQERHEFAKAYYSRNQQVIDHSDILVAFTEKNAGGTWDAIKRARKAGKPVKVIRPKAVVRQESQGGDVQSERKPREKGKGPFQLKRISLGSYALKLWRYLSVIQWVDLINAKDNDPERCAEIMIPDFLEFFRSYQYGAIHAITQAPKSVRNLGKQHPMDFVCQAVSQELQVEYVEMFNPWERRGRGRFAEHPEAVLRDGIQRYSGKVVYVLDDITTTNETLRISVEALMSIGLHSHGIAWVYYS